MIIVTTGRPDMTPEQYDEAIASLEARAALAERNGLPRVARSWRERIANMKPPEASVVEFVERNR